MTHINQRRDIATNWTIEDPVLQLGEVGWETDTLKAKLGDGVTAWTSLDYSIEPIAALLAASVTNGDTTHAPSGDAVFDAIAAAVVGLWDDRGNYDASSNLFPATGGSGASSAILKGDLWTISVSGTLGGSAVAIGDTVRALVDTPGQTASNWAIAETNIGYVAENEANKSTDGTLAANSTTLYPSQSAVKTYADTTAGGKVSDTAYAGSWDGVTGIAPSKNAVYDALEAEAASRVSGDGTNATNLTNHINDTVDAHDASAISYAGSAGLSATEVEGALDELDTEKAPLASPAFTGNPTAPTPAVSDDDTSIATTAFVHSMFLTATAVLNFGNITPTSTAALTVTVTGAAVGDAVFFGPPAALEAGLIPSGFVSAADTVTVRLNNRSAGDIDPASATWRVVVMKTS